MNKKEYQKQYRLEHKDKYKEYNKKWYQSHKEERKEYNKKWRENNIERAREICREYLKKHPELNKKSYENFKATHNWSEYCKEARKRRIERLKAQGITNPYAVINGAEPKYKEV